MSFTVIPKEKWKGLTRMLRTDVTRKILGQSSTTMDPSAPGRSQQEHHQPRLTSRGTPLDIYTAPVHGAAGGRDGAPETDLPRDGAVRGRGPEPRWGSIVSMHLNILTALLVSGWSSVYISPWIDEF
jgi:hypothetical protein